MRKKPTGTGRLVVLFICAFFITAGLTAVVYFWHTYYDLQEMIIDLRVSDYQGFNNDADAIHLGTTTPGGYLERRVQFASSKPAHISFSVIGLDFVSVTPQELILAKDSSASLLVYAQVPDEILLGDYEGVLRVVTRRP